MSEMQLSPLCIYLVIPSGMGNAFGPPCESSIHVFPSRSSFVHPQSESSPGSGSALHNPSSLLLPACGWYAHRRTTHTITTVHLFNVILPWRTSTSTHTRERERERAREGKPKPQASSCCQRLRTAGRRNRNKDYYLTRRRNDDDNSSRRKESRRRRRCTDDPCPALKHTNKKQM